MIFASTPIHDVVVYYKHACRFKCLHSSKSGRFWLAVNVVVVVFNHFESDSNNFSVLSLWLWFGAIRFEFTIVVTIVIILGVIYYPWLFTMQIVSKQLHSDNMKIIQHR